jgi:hypothetical protein
VSAVLLKFAESFVSSRISADVFCDAYIELWKIEGGLGLLPLDPPDLSECLSTIFCLADMYVPGEEPPEVCELDQNGLEAAVAAALGLLSEKLSPTA